MRLFSAAAALVAVVLRTPWHPRRPGQSREPIRTLFASLRFTDGGPLEQARSMSTNKQTTCTIIQFLGACMYANARARSQAQTQTHSAQAEPPDRRQLSLNSFRQRWKKKEEEEEEEEEEDTRTRYFGTCVKMFGDICQ